MSPTPLELFPNHFHDQEETKAPVEAEIKGTLPNWLSGTFLRVGPGKWDLAEDFTLNHFFDGYALLYKFEIKNGKVTFTKRFLESDAYKKAIMAKRPIFTEFGTKAFPDPCKNIFSRMVSSMSPSNMTDNSTANVFQVHDQVFSSSETCFLRRIDLETLDTKDKIDYYKAVSVNMATSHPIKSEEDGCVYNLGSSFISGNKYHIIRIPTPAKGGSLLKSASVLVSIPSRWSTGFGYAHSFGMSDNHLVFVEQPYIVSSVSLATSQVSGYSFRECSEWKPNQLNKFHVIEKASGRVLKTDYVSNEAFFCFHHVNTYEEDNQLIVDLIGYTSPDVIDKFYMKKLRMAELVKEGEARFRRYVLPIVENVQDLEEGTNLVRVAGTTATAVRSDKSILVTPEIYDGHGLELPSIHPKYEGKPYQYVYLSTYYDAGDLRNSLIKLNVKTGELLRWMENEFVFPGEPKFLPDPNGKNEDDGILLAACTDIRSSEKDFLLVLRAKDLSEIARCEVDVTVPIGIHGQFLHK